MNPYLEMLMEFGIHDFLDPCVLFDTSDTPHVFPDKPCKYLDGVAIFTKQQMEWADPEDFGFTQPYLVIDNQDFPEFGLNYSDEVLLTKKRKPHRYSRKGRFLFVLCQTLCQTGNLPKPICYPAVNRYRLVVDRFSDLFLPRWTAALPDLRKIVSSAPKMGIREWKQIREILKKNRLQVFYNRIPIIIAGLKDRAFQMNIRASTMQKITDDFDKMSFAFDELKDVLDRKYFPVLRYTALKLIEKNGVALPYDIPFTLSEKKRESLDTIYETLWDFIYQLEESAEAE